MEAYSCLFRNPFSWIAALGSLFVLAHSSGFGFLTLCLTTSALILCPVILSCTMSCTRKSILKEESPTSIQEVLSVHETSVESESMDVAQKIENECVIEKEAKITDKKEDRKGGDYLVSSSAALSDSESLDDHTTTSSTEESENDWIFRENLSQSTPCSDGSISDEESLIEITLPEGDCVDSWYGFQQKWPDYRMEMMNEMNEEENLIEIDIFRGSIKCSRFEIEA